MAAVVLAAGRSSRMGRPKLLLPWRGTSVLGHLIEQWRSLGIAQIAVVCAGGDHRILAELTRLRFSTTNCIYNPAPERGMFSSIRWAARWQDWKPDLRHWAIVLGDQPHLRPATLGALIDFAVVHPDKVCQPARGGRRHHPVVLPRAAFEKLARSSAPTLKHFLVPYKVATCEQDDPGLETDIDSPEDYQKALNAT
jgi:molybdenum cofactor cytidylyltransferase